MAVEDAQQKEDVEALIYYIDVYSNYIGPPHRDVTEEDIRREIENLDGKGLLL